MLSGVVRRLGTALAAVLFSTIVIFVLLRALPGDVATTRLGTDATPQALADLRREYGFDRPLIAQYFDWLIDIVRGDLGRSLLSGASVKDDVVSRLDVTLPLITASTVVSMMIAAAIGRRTALRRGHGSGVLTMSLIQLGLAIPPFVLAIGLIFLFAVQFKVLPAGGFPVSGWGSFTEALRSLILPTVALAAAQTAMLTRFARSSSLDFVASDAFRTARAVGRPRNDALLTAQRLVLSPVLTVASLQVATLITGAVVIESVFALPGLGSMLVRDIANRDYPKVQSVLFVVVLVVFALRTIVDLANDRLDPRRVA
ncbi:MAG: ABC-type dipeptide/oligopeptide/nickel transport system, permease component [Actinomycetota bacterium]|jgi:peptide/nickel transport system permease protein